MHPRLKFEEIVKKLDVIKKAIWHSENPELSYVFSEDDDEGKINVKKFFF
jgi:hypothetical protein